MSVKDEETPRYKVLNRAAEDAGVPVLKALLTQGNSEQHAA